MTRRAVIFGTGYFGEVVSFYLTHDSEYEVAAFTASADAIADKEFAGLPLVPFEAVEETYPPDDHDLFVAVGYARLNKVREQFCNEARAKGYTLLTYVCSKATTWGDAQIGDNTFVFEDNTIQPFVTIGDGVVLWSGNHIGHHASIGDYCFLTSHVVVSGATTVGARCFIGVNATLRDDIGIGADNLIGMGAMITRSTGAGEVHVAKHTERLEGKAPDKLL
jgi:sugar O-acyltransferase (sialic acid O-acetyltransferase NeuD family)